jgi:hypothetical protein
MAKLKFIRHRPDDKIYRKTWHEIKVILDDGTEERLSGIQTATIKTQLGLDFLEISTVDFNIIEDKQEIT